MKQSVIYLLRIWIIEGIPQISASCVWVVCLEVMGLSGQVFMEWLKTGMQNEMKSCCMTENIDSKILVMLDKWHHFSSQRKSVSIATFKAFYVWKSFAKCMQVTDGENKFNVK